MNKINSSLALEWRVLLSLCAWGPEDWTEGEGSESPPQVDSTLFCDVPLALQSLSPFCTHTSLRPDRLREHSFAHHARVWTTAGTRGRGRSGSSDADTWGGRKPLSRRGWVGVSASGRNQLRLPQGLHFLVLLIQSGPYKGFPIPGIPS